MLKKKSKANLSNKIKNQKYILIFTSHILFRLFFISNFICIFKKLDKNMNSELKKKNQRYIIK